RLRRRCRLGSRCRARSRRCGEGLRPPRLFFSQCYGDHRDLHSFPTRRSSDLGVHRRTASRPVKRRMSWTCADAACCPRSEEHTSELQSRSDLVCRLLLEKKKKKTYSQQPPRQKYTTLS